MNRDLNVVPEDRSRAMAVVAHPDDPDHGPGGAIARWTRTGRSAPSLVVTDGESSIYDIPLARPGPLRRTEQIASAAVDAVATTARTRGAWRVAA